MFEEIKKAVYKFYYEGDVNTVIARTGLAYEDAIELLYNFGLQHDGCYLPDADEAVDRWEDYNL